MSYHKLNSIFECEFGLYIKLQVFSNTTLEIKIYIDQKKELYNKILLFLEGSDEIGEESYDNLLEIIKVQQIQNNKEELINFLEILINIFNNHYRSTGFISKIEQILTFFQNDIKQKFTNKEIFILFESNKRILLFLIKEGILTVDENISELLSNKREANGIKFSDFFIPEIEKNDQNQHEKNERLNEFSNNIFEYEEKRNLGENDSYICFLIRQDSVEDFISYVNRTNLYLSSTIANSIFETNPFLNEHEPTLIEYAAFFGSIQIFQYLRLNKVELTSDLWLYTIHGKNAEIIHLLEDFHVQPSDVTYRECFEESIKCHHNDFAEYFKSNFMTVTEQPKAILKYHNFSFFPNDFSTNIAFFNLCQYNYCRIVNILLDNKKDYIKSLTILLIQFVIKLKKTSFNQIFKMIFS